MTMATEIRGRLDPTTLSEVFDLLSTGDRTWSLLVSDGLSEKIFYFSIGGIRMVAQGGRAGRSTGDILDESGKLDRGARRRIEEHAAVNGLLLGEAARDLGLVSREDVEQAGLRQLLEEVFDLCLWADAEYEIIEGQPCARFYDTRERACSASCDVPEFIRTVRERYLRWQSLMEQSGGDGGVLVPTEKGRRRLAQDRPDPVGLVLKLLDGHRSVPEVIARSKLPSLAACDAVCAILGEKLARRSGAAAESGPRNREQLLLEVQRLEESRKALIGDLIVRKRLARVYEELGEKELAAAVLWEIVRIDRSRQEPRSVLDTLRHIAALLPQDFAVREQIVDVLRALGEIAKMVEEGRSLAETLFRQNLLNRARRVLDRLLAVAPNDIPLRKLRALTLMGMGLDELALQELRALAELLERSGAPADDLREVYRRILALDGGQKAFRRKLRALGMSRRAIWTTRVGFVVAVLLLVGGIGSFLYEELARKGYEEERTTIANLVAGRRFEAARLRARAFRQRYPFASTDRRVLEFIGRIDDLEAEYLKSGIRSEMAEAEAAERAGDPGRARDIYRRVAEAESPEDPLVLAAREKLVRMLTADRAATDLVTKAESLAKQGKLQEAVRIYDEVRSLYPHTAAAATIRYPVEIDTIPAGARLFKNGEELPSVRPARTTYCLAEKNRFRVEAEGFEPLVMDVTEPLPARTVLSPRKTTRWVFTTEGPLEGAPVVHGDGLFIAGRDRWLYCLSVEDGTEIFRVSMGLFGDSGVSVAAVGRFVVAGTAKGEALGIDATDGRIRWRRVVGDGVSADLSADGERSRVLVTEARGTVLALDAGTGAVAWSSGVSASPTSRPVPWGRRVFVGSYDRRGLVALDANDGSEIFTCSVRSAVTGSPALDDSGPCFGAEDGGVYSVEGEGTQWRKLFELKAVFKSPPEVDGESIFVASLDGRVCRRNRDGFEGPEWDVGLGSVVLGGVTAAGDAVYAGTVAGTLFCLDRETGAVRWVFSTEGKIVARPVVRDGTVYVASMDGRLYAIAE
jgi:outer membrane protein assembly factor BamB/tetratricopeptide (TPR) repeat protein